MKRKWGMTIGLSNDNISSGGVSPTTGTYISLREWCDDEALISIVDTNVVLIC
jgi:hypothetical protein